MSDRTHPVILDHIKGVFDALTAESLSFPVGEWNRPYDANERFVNPPYAVVRLFPSAAEMDGPLSDTQIDIVVRVQIVGVGLTERQALNVTDLCRPAMKRSKITIPNRSVMDVRFMVSSAGVSRDDDLPTPYFNSSDLYEVQTTPA